MPAAAAVSFYEGKPLFEFGFGWVFCAQSNLVPDELISPSNLCWSFRPAAGIDFNLVYLLPRELGLCYQCRLIQYTLCQRRLSYTTFKFKVGGAAVAYATTAEMASAHRDY